MREASFIYYLRALDTYRTRGLHLPRAAMAKELGISPRTYSAWYRDDKKRRKPSSRYVRWIKSFLEARDILSADRWMGDEGLQLLRNIGFGEGDVVVDFGCGRGDFTLMLARVVGERGKVYSVDKDKGVLSELMGRTYGKGLTNVHGTFVARNEQPPTELPLPDASVNAFWLSDVLHDGYFKNDEYKKALVADIRRTLKEDGFVAVHPVHMEEQRLKKIIEEAGFCMDREYRRTILFHGSEFHKASIFRFKRAGRASVSQHGVTHRETRITRRRNSE